MSKPIVIGVFKNTYETINFHPFIQPRSYIILVYHNQRSQCKSVLKRNTVRLNFAERLNNPIHTF
jgi:hypothetical protein